jgi:hypothetical protein
MGTVVDFASRRNSTCLVSTDKSKSSPQTNPFEEQNSSKEWLSDTVMLALAQSYVRKAAELTRRVKGSDDAVAWMLEDIGELLTRDDSSTSPVDITAGNENISRF